MRGTLMQHDNDNDSTAVIEPDAAEKPEKPKRAPRKKAADKIVAEDAAEAQVPIAAEAPAPIPVAAEPANENGNGNGGAVVATEEAPAPAPIVEGKPAGENGKRAF